MDERLERFIRTKLRRAGKQFEEARDAYREGKAAADFDLPSDDEGRAKIVCRRHADRRAVLIDGDGRPACFDADHPDCRGCAADVREGIVETW